MCGKQSPDYINILIFFLQLIFMSGGANPECMPHDTDIEQENSPESESTYECLQCGEIATAKTHPSTCDCGGVFKPDVVLFGEQLPGAAIQRARSLARESDVFLAIGSSLVVQPAASLPRLAADTGATVGIVNLESTPCDDHADVVSREDVTTVLPRLRELVVK